MVYYCGACQKKIYDSHEASVLCVKCKIWIHQDCAELTDEQLEVLADKTRRKYCTCSKCKDLLTSRRRRKRAMTDKVEEANLTELFKKLEEKLHLSLNALKEDIKTEVVKEITQLKEESAKVQGILANWEEKLNLFKKEVKEEVSAEVESLKKDNDKFKSEIEELKSRVADQEKRLEGLQKELQAVARKAEEDSKAFEEQMEGHNMYSRKNNLEIHGIFEQDREEPYELVCAVANYLKVKCSPGDLVAAHRLPTRKPGAVKPIIVHFVCNWKKQEILAAWRERSRNRKLPTTQDINVVKSGTPPNNIYINEQLTARNKGLHKRARDTRVKGVKFVWTENGKVLLREKEKSPIIHVKNSEVMSELEVKFNVSGTGK